MNHTTHNTALRALAMAVLGALLAACGTSPEGIAESKSAATTVRMDFFHRPLPEIPLPNDIATRYDESSATGRRINASMIAPTELERQVRGLLDELDGWGVFQPITIPFTGPLSVESIIAAHSDPNYDVSDDVVLLIDIDPDSPDFGQVVHLDVGEGNYPVVLERREYWPNDPRGETLSLFYEEVDEDLNGNGQLDPGEDTDADGTLDAPNYRPGMNPAWDDLAGRADALMTFYERETNTLIVRPMVPLRERTTYAVVVTRRLLDAAGNPVGSPYPWVHHIAQTEALRPLGDVLPAGTELSDVAFAFTFTTQTIQSNWIAVRDGLYGHGVQSHLGTDYPAVMDELLSIREGGRFEGTSNPYILHTEEWEDAFALIGNELQGVTPGSRYDRARMNALLYVDYMAISRFVSPQLFDRVDAYGVPLPLNLQSWPQDLDRIPAEARPEDVFAWWMIPRREVSARGNDEPAPVIILGHGYGSNRFELAAFGGFLAQHGFAVVAVDNVSHGLGISPDELDQARELLDLFDLGALGDAVFRDRAFDMNNDGRKDSGVDFWTSYLFHTRDVVRQSLLDYHQLIRIVNTWDGTTTWGFDVNGDGQDDLAGDFDGDGIVDVGAGSSFYATGGSLGGIMSTLLGATEPNMTAIAPISGGGGLGDIGQRSQQGGVREAVILRVMGPLYLGTPDPDSGATRIDTVVPDLNRTATRAVASVAGVEPGDTVVATNLVNGEHACAYVSDEGTFRLGIESDAGDEHTLVVYQGDVLVLGSDDCELIAGATPRSELATFEIEVEYQGEVFPAGTPLRALTDGLGLRRANPEMRRFLGIGQAVLDGADPAVYARHMELEPLTYPGTGESTHTHAMIVTTLGDMNVPASSGVSVGRAAGFIDYLNDDPRWGVPPNQAILDNFVAEAVHNLRRYTFNDDPDAEGVHIDVENFSQGTDMWGESVPRLDEPLHLWTDTGPDGQDWGGYSGSIFPYPDPDGEHGFDFPGQSNDKARQQCRDACPEGEDCGCSTLEVFDVGWFMFNMMGRYFATDAAEVPTDLCMSRNDCDWIAPVPERRDRTEFQ